MKYKWIKGSLPFQVGDKVKDYNGSEEIITNISDCGTYPVCTNAGTYTVAGAFTKGVPTPQIVDLDPSTILRKELCLLASMEERQTIATVEVLLEGEKAILHIAPWRIHCIRELPDKNQVYLSYADGDKASWVILLSPVEEVLTHMRQE